MSTNGASPRVIAAMTLSSIMFDHPSNALRVGLIALGDRLRFVSVTHTRHNRVLFAP
jgi:hypothetical protein